MVMLYVLTTQMQVHSNFWETGTSGMLPLLNQRSLMLNVQNITIAESKKPNVDDLAIDKTIDLRQGDKYPLKTSIMN